MAKPNDPPALVAGQLTDAARDALVAELKRLRTEHGAAAAVVRDLEPKLQAIVGTLRAYNVNPDAIE